MLGGMKRLARLHKAASQPGPMLEPWPSTTNIPQQVRNPANETLRAPGFGFECGAEGLTLFAVHTNSEFTFWGQLLHRLKCTMFIVVWYCGRTFLVCNMDPPF